MSIVLECRNLVNKISDRTILNGVSLTLSKGQGLAILGPAGSGKTTLVCALQGQVECEAGEIYTLGINLKEDPKRTLYKVAAVPSEICIEPELRLVDGLALFANYHGVGRQRSESLARDALRRLNLEGVENEYPDNMTLSQLKRAQIAMAIVKKPSLVLLDEPTKGIDQYSRLLIWRIISELKSEGAAVLVTSDNLHEAEELADETMLLSHGEVIAQGKSVELVSNHIGNKVVEVRVKPDDLDYHVRRVKDVYEYQVSQNRIKIFVKTGQSSEKAMNVIHGEEVWMRRANLADVFLKMAGYEFSGQLRERDGI